IVELSLSADQPVAMVAVRLADVAPDDSATRVSYGILNLNHQAGADNPQPLEPGEKFTARVRLNGLAQSFPAGHRLRVSVSSSYWPVLWPSPTEVRLTVDPKHIALMLPRLPATLDDEPSPTPTMGDPEGAPPNETIQIASVQQAWTVSRTLVDMTGKLEVLQDLAVVRVVEIVLTVTPYALER